MGSRKVANGSAQVARWKTEELEDAGAELRCIIRRQHQVCSAVGETLPSAGKTARSRRGRAETVGWKRWMPYRGKGRGRLLSADVGNRGAQAAGCSAHETVAQMLAPLQSISFFK